jgi:TldD protein
LKTLTDRALNLAEVQGASYADIRVVHRHTQNISVKNGVVEGLADNESLGFGVRVVADGAWGFASSALLTPAEVDRVTSLFCRHIQDPGPDRPVGHRPGRKD